MFDLIRIGNDVYPSDRIKTVTLSKLPDGLNQLQVALTDIDETYDYSGDYAILAAGLLQNADCEVTIVIGEERIRLSDVQWVNLNSDFGGGTNGVEVRLASDPVNVTRQYRSPLAEDAYDLFNLIAPAPETTDTDTMVTETTYTTY